VVKVLHIQKSPKSAGGAALRLHNALNESDSDSYILTLFSDINDNERVIYPGKMSKVISWIGDRISSFMEKRRNKEYGLFSYPVLGTDISKIRQVRESDIIIIHWVQAGFFNLRSYARLADLGKPLVVVMHDMWTFTGGCHYSFSCEKYKSRCYECQVFVKKKQHDLSEKGFERKKKLFSRFNNLYFVSPSNWLYNCAKESTLLNNKPVFHIPNVIDNQVFKPLDKRVARRLFNLNPEDKIIAFGAVSINDPFKGWDYLQEALGIYKQKTGGSGISVLIFGRGSNSQIKEKIPFTTRFTGFLKDEYSLVMLYNAADVFVTPSLADNLPTTILESLLCGTPVVGFNTGGIPEMIEHRSNGYVARYKDSEDLAEGIRFCLESNVEGKLLPQFSKHAVLSRYQDLIKKILDF
jgi:glycosyltransferase involved in cell wall biosynthesis